MLSRCIDITCRTKSWETPSGQSAASVVSDSGAGSAPPSGPLVTPPPLERPPACPPAFALPWSHRAGGSVCDAGAAPLPGCRRG